jgi:uncharacterized caspase-like protein
LTTGGPTRLVRLGVEVEADVEQLDRSVGGDRPDDRDPANRDAGRDEEPVVRTTAHRLRQFVEARGEGVDDRKQVDRQEVVDRRFAARTALDAEHPVEPVELRMQDAD